MSVSASRCCSSLSLACLVSDCALVCVLCAFSGKTSKDGSVLLFCCNKADKGGKRKRNCRKKYCDACLRRAYNVAIEHFSQEEIDTWQCPACLRKCVCAACARKSDLALQATNKLAAAAVMQTALMHAPFSSMSGLNQLSLLNSMRPGMALSMQMHMAAAAAAIHQAPAAAAPVPAILPAVAVQAVPGAPVASPFQFAQPATTLASSTDAQPQLAQNGSSSGHSSHHSAHAAASVAAQAHGGVTLAAAVVGEHATARPRAFSCPTSPNHAAAQAYAFPPPVPAHAVSAYPIPAISKPGPGLPHPLPAHMLQQRVLPMQPSREARTAQADMTEGTPQRRRRHSLKVTPMGARSNAASRSGSPFKGANQQPITNEQYALQMHAQTQEPQPDFSQTNNFAHTLTQAASDAIPAMDYLEPTHQHHSAPVTPTSQRSRRGSALPYSVGPGMAVRAIDLSVRPPSSGQSSGPNSGQSSPRDSHRQASGNHESGLEMQMMLISPFQQSPQQSPFNLAQHTQHPLHSGTASSHRHGSGLHFLPSPPNQSMLASPMQQPQQQFHVSPHVSPQNQFAPSTLASYLQQIHPQSAHQQAQHPRPHPSELFASPLNASHELDLLSHGASLSLDVINQLQASVQSELATKAHLEQQQQLWQQQQQQQHQRQMQEQHHQQQLEQQHESTQDSQALTGSSTFPDSSLELTAFVDSGSAGLDPPLQLDAFHAGLHPSLLDGSTPPHAQMDSMGAHGPHMFSFAQPQTAAFAHGSDAASAKLAAAHGVSISSMTHGALPFLNTSPNTSPSHQQTAGAPLSSTLAETAPAAAAANGPVPSPPSSLAHNAGSSAFHTGSPTAEFLHMSPAAKTEAV